MEFIKRPFYMDVCNYKKQVICPLYDNRNLITGQAYDVFVSTERNGWKELSFVLPSIIHTENGDEPNFALDFLKADYLIRTKTLVEDDYFIISEPKIIHDGLLKRVDVTCAHISQLLKYKKLGLEFSDNEGNNVGTAEELLTTILEGTGWTVGYVADFKEKDDSIKKRSLVCGTGTGAFKMISMVCELFDAKPIYHGATQTVDIVELNPFADYLPGQIPNILKKDDVLEINYSKNLKNMTRTLDTTNMITKLSARGSYGDTDTGYCSIEECKHTEYTFTLTSPIVKGNAYWFTIRDDADVPLTYHFKPTKDLLAGTKLVFSLLDPCSMTYIWDEINEVAYPVEAYERGIQLPYDFTKNKVDNMFSFVMDFSYYQEIGLFDNEMLQQVATYQRKGPALLKKSHEAATQMADSQSELSKVIGSINFCKLAVQEQITDSYLKLKLDTTNYDEGVIYRSDYDTNKKNHFKWRSCNELDTKGDPINTATSILYIIHDTNPISWDITYLKGLDDDDNPTELTFWLESYNVDLAKDSFYLFGFNGINGILGPLQSADESALTSLAKATTIVTEEHNVIFADSDSALQSIDKVNGYGWLWRYFTTGDSELYFCFKDDGDTSWNRVWFTDVEPTGVANRQYWFDWRESVLYRREGSQWIVLSTDNNVSMLVPSSYRASLTDAKIAALFSTVYMYGMTRDRYYKGIPEKMTYTVPTGTTLAAGNYYFETPYRSYYVFTVNEDLHAGNIIEYTYTTNTLTMTINGVMNYYNSKQYRFDNVRYHPGNVLPQSVQQGYINPTDGSISNVSGYTRSSAYGSVVPGTAYTITGLGLATIHFYNDKKMWLSCQNINNGTITVPVTAYYIKVVKQCDVEDYPADAVMTANNKSNILIVENKNYFKLTATNSEEVIGIIDCMKKFKQLSDLTYGEYYQTYKRCQKEATDLEYATSDKAGNLWKEGRLEDDNYIDGDEDRLYEDALDTLKKLAKPAASYNIGYIDLYGSNIDDENFGVIPLTNDKTWPDINISTAVHLIDPEIGVNVWAYLDKIEKCYDDSRKTRITINTDLTTIAQHSFGDIMSSIADVASQVKAKVSKYDTASVTSVSYTKLEELLADLVTMTKISESAGGRIVEMENDITGHSSMFKQTADEITAEVNRATDAEAQLSASITIEADKINSRVSKIIPEVYDRLGYETDIVSNNGFYVATDIPSIVLSAVFKYANESIIDKVTQSNVKWYLDDNTTPAATGYSYTLSHTAVAKQAKVTVKITYKAEDEETANEYESSVVVINLDTSVVASSTAPENPYDGMLWLDNSSGSGVLMRYSEADEAWSAVTLTEDQKADTLRIISRYDSDITQLADQITSTVSQITELDDQTRTELERLSTTITQNADSINASIIQSKQDSNKYTDDKVKDMQSTIETWMRFSEDGLSLGKSNSAFTSRISNERMSFFDGNTEVSYIGNKALNITDAKVQNTLSMGEGVVTDGWFDWVSTAAGLGMKWKSNS